ncbi:hypothetical protein SK128_000355 [Halocaridina rubra]|uniref:Uncharacterized protein n=1 Tax=Halocaridina rubra TaxID=373956 RepID=A0AAN8XHQ7_HALRR
MRFFWYSNKFSQGACLFPFPYVNAFLSLSQYLLSIYKLPSSALKQNKLRDPSSHSNRCVDHEGIHSRKRPHYNFVFKQRVLARAIPRG